MGIFDIIGPVMVGPSSSHTAGAVRMGLFARRLLGGTPHRADIALHGSFAATGQGHGTHLAVLAGLLDLAPDDERIPDSPALAQACGLSFSFQEVDLGDVHPNSARIRLQGGEATVEVCGSSVGGGRIKVWNVDGLAVNLDGEYPTILMAYPDRPGVVAVVSSLIASVSVNIASIRAFRDSRGGQALLSIQCDQVPPSGTLEAMRLLPGTDWVRFVPSIV